MSNIITEAAKKAHWWFVLLLVSSIALVLTGMGLNAYTGSYAKAESLMKVQQKQEEQAQSIAVLKAVVPLMAEQVKVMFEVTRQEQYEKRHVVIPDPAAAISDAGVSP